MGALEVGRTAYADRVVSYAEQQLTEEEQRRPNARRLDAAEVSRLRGPHVEIIAQLLVTFQTPELRETEILKCFLEDRKKFNETLIINNEMRYKLGVTTQDLKKYTLKDEDIAAILRNSNSFKRVVLNPSQFHKLLSTAMSYTTCIDTIKLLQKRKFLEEGDFVISRNVLEAFYLEYMNSIVKVMQ